MRMEGEGNKNLVGVESTGGKIGGGGDEQIFVWWVGNPLQPPIGP